MKVIRDADIRPSGRKFVAMALADYADENWSCFPQIETLAKYTAQGEKTVRDHLDALEVDGVISRDRIRRSDGTLAGYRYRINAKLEPAADFASGENRQRRKTPEPAADFAAHEPPRKEPPRKRETAREKRRPELPIPENWVPSDRNISDAEARGFSQQDITNEADRFRDHHLARDTRFRDWDAAWRTWLGNARRFGLRVAGGKDPGRGGHGGSMASIAARRRASGQV